MRPNRRTFIDTLARASAAVALQPAFASTSSPLARPGGDLPSIDGTRLRADLEALSVFGRPPDGSFDDGVSRTAYSDADVEGRRFVTGLMREVALEPRVDAAGNIFATRAGRDAGLPPILFGSHIDSVPQGGNFDGDLGSLAAIEAVRAMASRRLTTRHPLEVVVWAHEEGGTFPNGLNGSRAVAGQLAGLDLLLELHESPDQRLRAGVPLAHDAGGCGRHEPVCAADGDRLERDGGAACAGGVGND